MLSLTGKERNRSWVPEEELTLSKYYLDRPPAVYCLDMDNWAISVYRSWMYHQIPLGLRICSMTSILIWGLQMDWSSLAYRPSRGP